MDNLIQAEDHTYSLAPTNRSADGNYTDHTYSLVYQLDTSINPEDHTYSLVYQLDTSINPEDHTYSLAPNTQLTDSHQRSLRNFQSLVF